MTKEALGVQKRRGKTCQKIGSTPRRRAESKTHLHQIFSLTPKSTQKTRDKRSCQARKWRIKKCCSTCSSIRFFTKGEVVNSSKNALRRLLWRASKRKTTAALCCNLWPEKCGCKWASRRTVQGDSRLSIIVYEE